MHQKIDCRWLHCLWHHLRTWVKQSSCEHTSRQVQKKKSCFLRIYSAERDNTSCIITFVSPCLRGSMSQRIQPCDGILLDIIDCHVATAFEVSFKKTKISLFSLAKSMKTVLQNDKNAIRLLIDPSHLSRFQVLSIGDYDSIKFHHVISSSINSLS